MLTTPVIRCIKQQLNAELHVVVKSAFRQVLQENPYVDSLKLLNDDLSACIQELKKENYTHIIDLHKNFRSWRISRSLQAPYFTFNKLNLEKWLMVNFKINRLPSIHIVDRYFSAVQSLGITNDGAGLDYFVAEKEYTIVQTLPAHYLSGYIAFVCGAMHETKRLPANTYIEIARKSKLPVVLIGGKNDFAFAESIQLQSDTDMFNACGRAGINESAVLISKAKAVLTNDTGMMHIAAAYQRPIVSVWGNTIPAFGMYPYLPQPGTKSYISEVNLSCRPCSKIGHHSCPKKHFHCMTQQDASRIAKVLNDFATI